MNEFLRELAPMKEAQFWHEFIARLMMGVGGGGKQQQEQQQSYYGTSRTKNTDENHFNHNHLGRYPKLPPDSFPSSSTQYYHNNNKKQYQQNRNNKEFICSTIKDYNVGNHTNDDEEFLVINPPVPVYTKTAKKYHSRIFSPPPPPTLPKPKFFKLFQPSIYQPPKRKKLLVARILPTSLPQYQQQQYLFLPENFDSFKEEGKNFHQNHYFYDCHLNQNPYIHKKNLSQFHRNMAEEVSPDDTLTEDATITTIGDSQTIASPTEDFQPPQSSESPQPSAPELESTLESQQPQQEEIFSKINHLKEEKELIEDHKNQTIRTESITVHEESLQEKSVKVVVKDKPPKSPLQRSLSEPNAGAEKQLNMLQKSPSRPIFTSSSFYDPNYHPTLEDQVKLCREIAKQLVSDDSNAKSKGREMFERRVQKSSGWITENDDSFQNYSTEKEDYHERTIDDGPPNLKLLLDPRHVEDINTVQGVNEHIIVTQEAKTRDTCKSIVNDLNSPEVNPNRGNALFAKRVQKSEEWIVDEVAESVVDAARDRLFKNVKQQKPTSNPSFNWSARSSPIPPPSQPQPPQYQYQQQPQNLYHCSFQQQPQPFYSYPSRLQIPGPIFSPVPSMSSLSSRPSSSMSMMSQFKDFNARPKPFCRAY